MVSFATRARRTFEVEYGARRGTTENAYATRGEKDACLIDCVDGRHAEGYAREIEALGGVGARRGVSRGAAREPAAVGRARGGRREQERGRGVRGGAVLESRGRS